MKQTVAGSWKTQQIFQELIFQRNTAGYMRMRVSGTADWLYRKVSAEELEELKKEDDSYDATDIVGKTGLESVLETTLQGDKGSETSMSTTWGGHWWLPV